MNIARLCLPLLLAGCSALVQAAGEVRVSNWSQYIADDTLKNFTGETGVQVVYDIHDSNEVLESKLMTGSTGYDVVSPSNHFISKLIKAGAIQELDRSQLPNWKNLDPVLMKVLEVNDPGNRYGFPYMWGTVGIGYNVKKIEEIFGSTEITRSWAMLLKEENIKKLSQCGVAMIDNPTQILPITLNYLGLPHHSHDAADYRKAEQALMAIRPYIQYFHPSKYVTDLANGDICAVIGFNGDILQAGARAQEANNGVTIAYSIPDEGSTLWFDMVVMPRNAPDSREAYAYMNYLLRPEVIANISNAINYANPNLPANALVVPALRDNPAIYPQRSIMDKLFTVEELPFKVTRLTTRLWTKVKSGT
ncbi:spermidine/putrescine-binding protein [Metapseudomonas resinovorans]|uniref:polyamine ABC transporter substrate-binding protein n=1 Tax=Metapseudomonas resinovorans TaxID=53412 RepID=UPI000987A176|nr:polyamine ABC transporter substrate-binding protein [Pseudomonas resinovorans]GLZ89212.1 spermidine/putrescine-binding protein [Pseudomonas resinovorans]